MIRSLEKHLKNEENLGRLGAKARQDVRSGQKIRSCIYLEFENVRLAVLGKTRQRYSGQQVWKSSISFVPPSHKGCCYDSCHYGDQCLTPICKKQEWRHARGVDWCEQGCQKHVLSGYAVGMPSVTSCFCVPDLDDSRKRKWRVEENHDPPNAMDSDNLVAGSKWHPQQCRDIYGYE